MIQRKTNTFDVRLDTARHTIDGIAIPSHCWDFFLTLWRCRGTSERVFEPIIGKAMALNRLFVDAASSLYIERVSDTHFRLTGTSAIPHVRHTGAAALPETEAEVDEISFSDLKRNQKR